MTRTQFSRRLFTAFFALMISLCAANSVLAATWHHVHTDPDTGLKHYVVDVGNDEWVYAVVLDGEVVYAEEIELSGNPNPEDGTTTPGDEGMWKALLKQQGGTGYLTPEFEDTPLGGILAGQGIGKGNYHNPGYDEVEGGLSPSSSQFYNPKDFANEENYGGLGVGGFNFNGGPIGEQLKNGIRKNNGRDHSDDNDEGPDVHPFFDDFMVGPPELINPNPARRY